MWRELLWRKFPTGRRGTYFRQFWDVAGRVPPPATEEEKRALLDIPEIHTWDTRLHLGRFLGNGSGEGNLILLIRGDLMRRYPNTIIYAVSAVWVDRSDVGDQDIDGNIILEDRVRVPKPDAAPGELRHPIFFGQLEPDVTFFGFELSVEEAYGSHDEAGNPDPNGPNFGWFFVLQEQPSEPRFGLDEAESFQVAPGGALEPAELSWGHVAADAGAFAALKHVPVAASQLANRQIADARWGRNGAHMAYITMQQPMMVAIHADDMLSPPD
jgi:hypothetical protein